MSREDEREKGRYDIFLFGSVKFHVNTRSSMIHDDECLSIRCVAGRKRLSRGKVGKRVNANVSLPARCTSSCYTINRLDIMLPPAPDSRFLLDLVLFAARAFRLHVLAVTHLKCTKYMRALYVVDYHKRKENT